MAGDQAVEDSLGRDAAQAQRRGLREQRVGQPEQTAARLRRTAGGERRGARGVGGDRPGRRRARVGEVAGRRQPGRCVEQEEAAAARQVAVDRAANPSTAAASRSGSGGSAGPRKSESERLRSVAGRSSREGASSRKWRGLATPGSSIALSRASPASADSVSAAATTKTWPRASKGDDCAARSHCRVASAEVEVLRSRSSTAKSGWKRSPSASGQATRRQFRHSPQGARRRPRPRRAARGRSRPPRRAGRPRRRRGGWSTGRAAPPHQLERARERRRAAHAPTPSRSASAASTAVAVAPGAPEESMIRKRSGSRPASARKPPRTRS